MNVGILKYECQDTKFLFQHLKTLKSFSYLLLKVCFPKPLGFSAAFEDDLKTCFNEKQLHSHLSSS